MSAAQQESFFFWVMIRHDICHKHHKQRLCKIIPTLGRICYGEQISSVILKTILQLLIKLISFSFKAKNNLSIEHQSSYAHSNVLNSMT